MIKPKINNSNRVLFSDAEFISSHRQISEKEENKFNRKLTWLPFNSPYINNESQNWNCSNNWESKSINRINTISDSNIEWVQNSDHTRTPSHFKSNEVLNSSKISVYFNNLKSIISVIFFVQSLLNILLLKFEKINSFRNFWHEVKIASKILKSLLLIQIKIL